MRIRIGSLLALSLLVSTRVFACATISTTGDGISIAQESALIVWDKKTQTEHFIRRANFETRAKNFGFLVPTPSKPELAKSDDALFTALEEQLKPKIETRTMVSWQFGWLLMGKRLRTTFNSASGSLNVAGAKDAVVEVFGQQQVGDYDAAILRANDTNALQQWLKANGYSINAETSSWLQPYIAKKWFITAFKIRRAKSANSASISPVRLSFRTDRPFYPYREPVSARQKVHKSRNLQVFMLGDERFTGRIESSQKSGSWPANTRFSAPLEPKIDFSAFSLPKTLDTSKMRLTVFDDTSSPRPAYGDLYFSSATDQRTITLPPSILWKQETRTIPFEVFVLGLFGLCLFFAEKSIRAQRK